MLARRGTVKPTVQAIPVEAMSTWYLTPLAVIDDALLFPVQALHYTPSYKFERIYLRKQTLGEGPSLNFLPEHPLNFITN